MYDESMNKAIQAHAATLHAAMILRHRVPSGAPFWCFDHVKIDDSEDTLAHYVREQAHVDQDDNKSFASLDDQRFAMMRHVLSGLSDEYHGHGADLEEVALDIVSPRMYHEDLSNWLVSHVWRAHYTEKAEESRWINNRLDGVRAKRIHIFDMIHRGYDYEFAHVKIAVFNALVRWVHDHPDEE